MASPAQITANQLNAQRSTGPRTAEGKERTSQNALKSGLYAEALFIPGENPQDFAEMQERYFQQYEPQNAEERYLVDTLIRTEWMLRRLFRVETALWNHAAAGGDIGEGLTRLNKVFTQLQRRITLAEQTNEKVRKELLEILVARQQAEEQERELASFQTSSIDAGPVRVPASASAGAPSVAPAAASASQSMPPGPASTRQRPISAALSL